MKMATNAGLLQKQLYVGVRVALKDCEVTSWWRTAGLDYWGRAGVGAGGDKDKHQDNRMKGKGRKHTEVTFSKNV